MKVFCYFFYQQSYLGIVSGIVLGALPSMAYADEELRKLGERRLFMSAAQRIEIDQLGKVPDTEPEKATVTIPAPVKVKKMRSEKVTLNGAVIRPDKSTVLILNDKPTNASHRRRLPSGSMTFALKLKGTEVTISPGQTVKIRTINE